MFHVFPTISVVLVVLVVDFRSGILPFDAGDSLVVATVAHQLSGEALNILLRLLNERCAVTWTAKEVGHGQFERVSIVFSCFL